ncbi:hypothetical protein CHS0354_030955 [Potamilus streckersoni]|uniref:ABC transporter domain-containing protein n=1 Tax=Potamilus streckersoni TaxID=2493646 RepID=A0AAE0RYN3_9BIVA|nr:hypothetical protein CHS0354_030955 [Potamilus streckersoni]
MDEEKPLLSKDIAAVRVDLEPPTPYGSIAGNHPSLLTQNEVASQFRQKGSSSLLDGHEAVTLTWQNINVNLNPPSRGCFRGPDPNTRPKPILRNVHGTVKPGTLLAILGASGSGKTTLLNSLTSRFHPMLDFTGEVLVNGVDFGRGIRNISAYVQQDDLFIATMTVREHLTFRALLRMDKNISKERRIRRVEEVINELGLTKCAENIIGAPGRMKGISGGEMRRLSFASEIMTNPPLLFCDEATSGLDSFMAENIVQTLKAMASRGKTILCTIHQPSSEVYALFDQVLVMAEGRVAYMGSSPDALEFFKQQGYLCPVNYNPADYYIMTLAVVPGRESECRDRVEKICDGFKHSEFDQKIEEEYAAIRTSVSYNESDISDTDFSNTSRYESSWVRQMACLLKRCWLTNLREPMVIRVRFAQTVMIGLILGLIYLRLDVDQKGVQNINGVLFLLITNLTFTNVFAVVNAFPIELPIFLREYGIGLYRVDSYFLSKMLAELPTFIIIPFILVCIDYWMVGLYDSAEAFLICAGILLLVANICVSFGYLISTIANSVNMALAIGPPLMVPLLMFGGFFLNAGSVPKYFIWLEYLSWFKYANELLAINQWKHIDHIACPAENKNDNVTSSPNRADGCQYRNGEQVLKYFSFDEDNWYLDFALLATLLVAFRILAFIILFIKARRSTA